MEISRKSNDTDQHLDQLSSGMQQQKKTRRTSFLCYAISKILDGKWFVLKKLKVNIVACVCRMGPPTVNIFKPFLNAIWRGCGSIYDIFREFGFFISLFSVVLCILSFTFLFILCRLPWALCSIVSSRFCGVKLVSFDVTRSPDHISLSMKEKP